MLERAKLALPDDLRSKTLLCAVSGGADSMVLLHVLQSLSAACGFTLKAAHLHHGLRGEEADRDAAFVAEACRVMGVALCWTCKDVRAIAAARKQSVELAAREVRRAFLLQTTRECGASYIALGHHMDDQAETVLLNMVRGTGLLGLRGMCAQDGPWVRPLLDVRRSEIEDYARHNGIAYVTDSTNVSREYARNRLRALMPELEQVHGGCVANIARMSKQLALDEAYLEEQARQVLCEMIDGGGVNAQALANLPWSVASRVLRQLAKRAGMGEDLSHKHVALILRFAATGENGSLDLPRPWRVCVEYGVLSIIESSWLPRRCLDEAVLCVPGETSTPWGRFICELTECPQKLGENWPDEVEVNPEALRGATVRLRRAGDRIWPLGADGSKSLSDFFIDRKIGRGGRDTPLIVCGQQVIWAVGHAISQRADVRQCELVCRLRFYLEE